MTRKASEMNEDEQRGQAKWEVTSLVVKYRQFGSVLDVTPVENLAQYFPASALPDKAWIVRFHVLHPDDRTDIFLVALRNERIAIAEHLGYDPIEEAQEASEQQ